MLSNPYSDAFLCSQPEIFQRTYEIYQKGEQKKQQDNVRLCQDEMLYICLAVIQHCLISWRTIVSNVARVTPQDKTINV